MRQLQARGDEPSTCIIIEAAAGGDSKTCSALRPPAAADRPRRGTDGPQAARLTAARRVRWSTRTDQPLNATPRMVGRTSAHAFRMLSRRNSERVNPAAAMASAVRRVK